MLVYPTFAIIAALGIQSFFEIGAEFKQMAKRILSKVFKTASIVIGICVLGFSIAWAVSFVHIYNQPITRIAASSWIFQNVPGPINLQIDSGQGVINQPVVYPFGVDIYPSQPVSQVYTAPMDGNILSLIFSHVVDMSPMTVDANTINPTKT